MVSILSILSLAGAVAALAALTWIDLKVRLLPNTYVLAFALFGVAFHVSTQFLYVSPADSASGVIIGGGLLYLVRFFANRAYNADTLGLGDVKLMMAAGLWLGVDGVLLAIILGACAGIVHGLGIYFVKKPGGLARLSLPAGPGFIIGILAAGGIEFLT